MNGSPVDKMSRDELEHELKLLRLFNDSYAEVVKLTCEKVTAAEACLYDNYFRFNDGYYLHPNAKKNLTH